MDIQVGDRVIFEGGIVKLIYDSDRLFEINQYINGGGNQIIKIERPKYEVVEEKKELLTKEEKEFLRQALKFGNYGSDTGNGTIKFIVKSGYFIELYYKDWTCNTIYIDQKLYFKNLEQEEQYTLKELGLEGDQWKKMKK